jgi:inosine-uridine nucleoside N-ribohydrolase
MEVSIETKGEYTKGMTVVDVRNHPKSSTNAFVVLKADKA